MSNFSRQHPAMAAKVMDLIESGLDPEQIIQKFKADDEKKALEDIEGDSDDEIFPDEVKIISQALAYREAVFGDALELSNLLRAAYQVEVTGSESFRKGESVEQSTVESLLTDTTYKWLLVEAPSGKGIEQDGVILGAVCYSMDGVARRNGVVEGNLGSIRFLGVLPRYHGFCVGRRLLERAETTMFSGGCCLAMVCIPSTRTSAMDWIERRGYTEGGCQVYPASGIGHVLKEDISDVQLVRFVKRKEDEKEDLPADGSDSSATWHLKNVPRAASAPATKPHHSSSETSAHIAAASDESEDAVFIPDVD
jgi:GNAT superfamily N-acetyltransferase